MYGLKSGNEENSKKMKANPAFLVEMFPHLQVSSKERDATKSCVPFF